MKTYIRIIVVCLLIFAVGASVYFFGLSENHEKTIADGVYFIIAKEEPRSQHPSGVGYRALRDFTIYALSTVDGARELGEIRISHRYDSPMQVSGEHYYYIGRDGMLNRVRMGTSRYEQLQLPGVMSLEKQDQSFSTLLTYFIIDEDLIYYQTGTCEGACALHRYDPVLQEHDILINDIYASVPRGLHTLVELIGVDGTVLTFDIMGGDGPVSTLARYTYDIYTRETTFVGEGNYIGIEYACSDAADSDCAEQYGESNKEFLRLLRGRHLDPCGEGRASVVVVGGGITYELFGSDGTEVEVPDGDRFVGCYVR